jgi:hemolysin activation/secretion protein
MTLSYSTSPENIQDVTQLGVFYRAPIYSRALGISAFLTYSSVDQGQVADFFEVSGSGKFAGISLDYAFLPVGFYTHKLTAGFQSRLFENDTVFELEDIGIDVRSTPVSFRYDGRWERARGNGGFFVEYARNIEAGSDNDDITYALTRPGAEPAWQGLRYGADLELNFLENWMFKGRFTGQAADEPLIPGEQYGIGGIRTVRGFDERAVTAESGQHVSAEIWAPAFNPNLRALGFVDLGWLQAQDPVLVGEPNEFIAGAGLGLRWYWVNRWHNDIFLQLDAAHVLNDATTLDSGFGKVHFNLFFRF